MLVLIDIEHSRFDYKIKKMIIKFIMHQKLAIDNLFCLS